MRMEEPRAGHGRLHPLDGHARHLRRPRARDGRRGATCSTLAGLDTLLIETVGVGQSEVRRRALGRPTVVVLRPGGGDSIQAMKAGLHRGRRRVLVNKSDLPGADRLVQQLQDILELRDLPRRAAPAHPHQLRDGRHGRARGGRRARRAARRARARAGAGPAARGELRAPRAPAGGRPPAPRRLGGRGAGRRCCAERVAQGLPQPAYGLSDEILTAVPPTAVPRRAEMSQVPTGTRRSVAVRSLARGLSPRPASATRPSRR